MANGERWSTALMSINLDIVIKVVPNPNNIKYQYQVGWKQEAIYKQ